MVRGAISKLIFIDSSVATHGDHAKVLVPPHPLSAGVGERMALSLVSFSMRRNWYNINPTNNTFYIFTANTYHEVQIESGVYPTFATLATAINSALTDDEGLMAFKMCLRWDLFVPPKPPPPEHKLAFEKPPTV